MRLLWPAALLLLLLVPVLLPRLLLRPSPNRPGRAAGDGGGAAARLARLRAPSPALRFPDGAPLAGLPASLRSRLSFLPGALVLAAVALGAAALARPQTGLTRDARTSSGVDIVLALDISSSMRAEDFAPANRLAAAKEVLLEFVRGRERDRLGAVAFARNAVTITPLTLDHEILEAQLAEVGIGDIEDGTAIGNAIAASVNRLAGSEAESRVIVLLTDGVSNAGEIHPLTAAGLAKARGIRVYTVGAGRETGGAMPVRGPGGAVVTRRAPGVDAETLRKVAEATGGRYFQARDTEGLRAVYDEIDALERTEFREPDWTSWADDGPRLAGWAAGVLFLAVGLGATAFRTAP